MNDRIGNMSRVAENGLPQVRADAASAKARKGNGGKVPHLTSSYTMQRTAGVRIWWDF
ncbi:hypothetical protein VWY06_01575 [Phaeobacter sp. JH20_10]|uniref:hypothetical protein n=1 Tax=Phaeobacter TaxID=302485 RepID=UPI003A85607B